MLAANKKNMRQLNLLIIIGFLILISCNNDSKKIYSNSAIKEKHDYRIVVEIGNPFSGYLKRIVINNSDLKSPLFYSGDLKPFYLYTFHYKREWIQGRDNLNKSDTISVKLRPEQADSIFYLASDFIDKFKIARIDTVTNRIFTTDDSYARVSVGSKERTLEAILEYLSIERYHTSEYTELMNYLKKFEKK
jgi:hypothetical protein